MISLGSIPASLYHETDANDTLNFFRPFFCLTIEFVEDYLLVLYIYNLYLTEMIFVQGAVSLVSSIQLFYPY